MSRAFSHFRQIESIAQKAVSLHPKRPSNAVEFHHRALRLMANFTLLRHPTPGGGVRAV